MTGVDHALLMRVLVIAAVALISAGAVAAFASTNVAKRLAGLIVALLGALVGLAALGAPGQMLSAGVAVAFAQIALGSALLVRLHESYGETETPEIDAADARDEPSEPSL